MIPIEVSLKNDRLVDQLEKYRTKFAGIGTNKAKRRLNKLAKEDPIAKAVRIAIEIEDKSIQGKKYVGKYKDIAYTEKSNLILQLAKLFQENNWVFGKQLADEDFVVNYVVYFEIPGCEQISFHIYLDNKNKTLFPDYKTKWDGKTNSTLPKLEKMYKTLLEDNENKNI